MTLIRKNKSAVEFLTPTQKRNRRLKHIKEDSKIKSKLVKFEEKLTDKNIFDPKYVNGKIYSVGSIWPFKYGIKNTKRIPFNYKDDEFVERVYIPDCRLVLKPNKIYTLIISYPLTNQYEQKIDSGKDGVTLRELVDLAVNAYRKIYEEEKKTSTLKEESISKRTKGTSSLINRAQTNGKYGIYGHSINDLTITHIIVKGNKIYLSVDS